LNCANQAAQKVGVDRLQLQTQKDDIDAFPIIDYTPVEQRKI
jgi:hypothetical protein